MRPRLVRTILPDKLTGVTSAQAITAALLARERGGQGQHVRLSMLDSVVAFLWASDMGSQTFVGDEFPQDEAQSFIDLIYETADGHISVAVQSDKEWAGLARAVERPELLEDSRFKTVVLRQENIDARLAATQEALHGRNSAEWLARLEAEDVPCAPILRRRDMIDHPQILANETVVETEHPQAGPLRQARAAARFSHTPAQHRHGAPRLGEHTREALEAAGVRAAELDTLAEQAVIGLGDPEAVREPAP